MRIFTVEIHGTKLAAQGESRIWANLCIVTGDEGNWRDVMYEKLDLSGVLIQDKDCSAVEITDTRPRATQLGGNIVIEHR